MKKITVYLYSMCEPLIFETDYFWGTSKDLSDERFESFTDLGGNLVRKSDISKIFVEEIKDKKGQKEAEIKFEIDEACADENGTYQKYVVLMNKTGEVGDWVELTKPFDTKEEAQDWLSKIKEKI